MHIVFSFALHFIFKEKSRNLTDNEGIQLDDTCKLW